MFLEPTEHQPLKRRSQLEHIPLLLLRCLALLLLAAMFSRPFFADKDSEAVAGLKSTVILLDVSASMQRADAWEQAVEIASQAISEVGPEGGLGIVTIGQGPRTLFSFDDWRNSAPARRADAAGQAIAEVSPGWGGSDLGSGLMAAAEMIADAAAGEGDVAVSAEIVLVSDLQSGAELDAIAEAAWPDDLSVTLTRADMAVRVVHLSSRDCGFFEGGVKQGRYKISVEFPECMLYPGIYNVAIWVAGYDYVQDVLSMEILQSNVSKRSSQFYSVNGIYYSPSAWNLVK